MSVSSIHEYSSRPIMRAFCFALAMSLFYSASASSINTIIKRTSEEVQQSFEDYVRLPRGWYTERPARVFSGDSPGRDPLGRGVWWTPRLRSDLARVRANEALTAPIADRELLASITPILGLFATQSGGEGTGGGGAPGEGGGEGGGSGSGGQSGGPSGGSGGGELNTNTGNRHVAYPIVGWSARGDIGIDFQIHHNSMGAYSFDLGKGWSHGYDVKISYTSGSSAIVRYGDGLEVPYTETSGVFTAPAGIHDDLVLNGGGTWTITSKDRSALEFNTAGRLIEVVDANGNTITISRDSNQKITSIGDGTGRNLTFAYTSGGLIETVTDPASREWGFTYDSNNDMTGITYPELDSQLHSRTFTYDSLSNILTETDLRGKVWSQTYDSSERLVSFTNPLSYTWTWSYSSTASTLTLPNSETIIHNYSAGKIASAVDQAGFSTAYVYDSDRNVTSLTDKRGKIWSYTYDSDGNLLTSTNPLAKTTSYTYSSGHDLLTVTDPLSNVDTYTYDSYGNLLTHVDGLSRTVSTLTYNGNGEVTSITDALSRQTTFDYNSQGDLTQTTAPGSVTSYATYDVLGRVVSATDAAGNTSSVDYDEWGRAISATEPGSATSYIDYDLESNIVSATDPLGRTGSRILDDLGRTTSATNAKSETTSYTYNSVGHTTSVTNGRGYTRTYTHTDRGEVASLTLPDSSVETWAYDGTGNTTAYTNPLGQTIAYTYDDSGQQVGVDYPSGLTDTSFTYDNAGQQSSMTDGTGTSSWAYNAAGEITALSTPQGNIDYTYNLAGQIATMVDVGTGTTTTLYDTAGRPSTVTDAFGDISSYTYDTAGRLSRIDNANGTYEEYGYDTRNRVTSIVTKNSSGTILQSRVYTFDLASQITQVVEGGVTTSFTYDAIGQLASEIKGTSHYANYTYDANGNRATKTTNGVLETYAYDNADKLTGITGGSDPRTFSYDAAGRTTEIVRSSGTTAFTYDYESRVTSITKPGMTTNTFSYNGLDTRVGSTDSTGTKTFKRNGVGVTAPVLSDGSASYTPTGEMRSGVKTTYHSALKNADIQTNSSQVKSASKVYDAFGNLRTGSGSWKGQFHYGGQFGYQQDTDSGLKLLGHRYYDSSTGRFLTRDPIKDGRNWYSYCGNNPITKADPSGTILETILDIAGACADIYDISQDPSDVGAWGSLVWSVAAMFIPFVPGSWVKHGAKGVANIHKAHIVIKSEDLASAGYDVSKHTGFMGKLRKGNDVHKYLEKIAVDSDAAWRAELKQNGVRPDLFHPEFKQIIEIKPDNDRQIKNGVKQLMKYEEKLEQGSLQKFLLTYSVE